MGSFKGIQNKYTLYIFKWAQLLVCWLVKHTRLIHLRACVFFAGIYFKMAAYTTDTRRRGLFRTLPRKVFEPLLLPQYALLIIQYLTLLAALENLKLETLDLDFPHTRARTHAWAGAGVGGGRKQSKCSWAQFWMVQRI